LLIGGSFKNLHIWFD